MNPKTPHTFTIKRKVVVQGAAGGASFSYTAAGRSNLPTVAKGRAIILSAKEKIEHGIQADIFAWKFLIPNTDPEVDERDELSFDYIDGQSHTVRVLTRSYARSVDGRFYKFMGEEKATES